MGFINSFKRVRALPTISGNRSQGFILNRFQPMRRLQVLQQPVALSPTFATWFGVFVPPGAWGDQHELLIRVDYEFIYGGAPVPIGTNIIEQISPSPIGTAVPLPNGPIPPGAGSFYASLSRKFYRYANEIYYSDDDDTAGIVGATNKAAGTSGIQLAHPTGSWDFTHEISFMFDIQNAGIAYGATIFPKIVLALMQTPLNLRSV